MIEETSAKLMYLFFTEVRISDLNDIIDKQNSIVGLFTREIAQAHRCPDLQLQFVLYTFCVYY